MLGEMWSGSGSQITNYNSCCTSGLDPTSYLIVAAVTALLSAWHSGGTYKSAGVFPDLNVRKKVKLDEI